jgi:two-component system nitrate/nitrite response regulator NarL
MKQNGWSALLTLSLLNDLRVLIVASSPLARAGLAALLADQPGVSVIGQVAPDAELPDATEVYRPDAMVWDMGWEPLHYIDRLHELRGVPVLALLADERSALEVMPPLLGAGVRGMLLQDASVDTLTAALGALARGLLTVHGALAEAAFSRSFSLSHSGEAENVESLTPREAEVLTLIAEGLPNKTIASRLSISEHTVKFHVNAILTKLGAQSRTEAVVRATRLGLIAL